MPRPSMLPSPLTVASSLRALTRHRMARHLARGRFREADRLGARWLARHADDHDVREQHALSAHNAGRYAEAAYRWRVLRELAPERPMAHAGLACNYRELRADGVAATVIAAALPLFPGDRAVEDEARRIVARLPRDERSRLLWRLIIGNDPQPPQRHLEFVDALLADGEHAAAGAELDSLLAEHPDRDDLRVRRFQAALDADDWAAAARSHAELPKRLTHTPEVEHHVGVAAPRMLPALDALRRSAPEAALAPYRFAIGYVTGDIACWVAYVECCLDCGRVVEAATVLARASALLQGVREFSLLRCLLLARQGAREEASRRLDVHLAGWPGDAGAVALRATLLDDAPSSAPRDASLPAPEDSGAVRSMLLRFQSLGQNCEFGLVQRACGGDPMSLFRFNTTTLASLIEALAAGLAGIGDPLYTTMEPYEDHEWYLYDTRWGFGFHTFISKAEATHNELFPKMCRHLAYLSRKQIEDLQRGDKTFVVSLDRPTLPELRRLHGLMKGFGPNRLLCVTPLAEADALGHPGARACDIREIGDGLHVGYISWLGRGTIGWRIEFDEWLEICRRCEQASVAPGAILAGAPL